VRIGSPARVTSDRGQRHRNGTKDQRLVVPERVGGRDRVNEGRLVVRSKRRRRRRAVVELRRCLHARFDSVVRAATVTIVPSLVRHSDADRLGMGPSSSRRRRHGQVPPRRNGRRRRSGRSAAGVVVVGAVSRGRRTCRRGRNCRHGGVQSVPSLTLPTPDNVASLGGVLA
jgi:hypothetical protein